MATFKRIRSVTLSVLKIAKGQPRFFGFIGPMHLGKEMAAAAGKEARKAATLIHAVDLESGEEGVVIVPQVMQTELNEAYPGEGYVRRCFEVTVTRDMEKKYNHVSISEVAAPDDLVWPASQAAQAADAAESKATPKPKK